MPKEKVSSHTFSIKGDTSHPNTRETPINTGILRGVTS